MRDKVWNGCLGGDWLTPEEDVRRRALCAAAPDLLEALEALVDHIEMEHRCDLGPAQAAIKKARGQ